MHYAAVCLHADPILRYIAYRGVSVDMCNCNLATPLHWAATNTQCKNAVKMLLDLGVSKDATDILGNTPLHYAAESGNIWAAKHLFDS